MYPIALLRLKVGKMPSLSTARTEAYAGPYFDGIARLWQTIGACTIQLDGCRWKFRVRETDTFRGSKSCLHAIAGFVDQRRTTIGSDPLFRILEGRWNGKIGAFMP